MSDSSQDIHEFDLVALTSPLPDSGLSSGQTGTVLHVHDNGVAFEVEFPLTPKRSIVATVGAQYLLRLHGMSAAQAG